MLATIQSKAFCLPALCKKNVEITIYKNIIMPVVLYRFETWSLTLKKEHRLRVFENKMLRRIYGPKRNEVTTGWRKLCDEELHNLYSSQSIIRIMKSRRMRWALHVARMWKREMRMGYLWESQREIVHKEDRDVFEWKV
jgi:hypothetical protein